MNPTLAGFTAALLAFAVVASSARILWPFLRNDDNNRPHAWRIAVLLLAQVASALLLYCVLFPPAVRSESGMLVVATAAANLVPRSGLSPGAHLVAMPEAPSLRDAERMPDLATALRRYPATTRLRVIGTGLTARDQSAVAGRSMEFVPAPLPRGLVALWPPPQVTTGRSFKVGGRAEGLRGGTVELLDPGMAIVARAATGADGRFQLAGVARSAGPATWQLRLSGRSKMRIETLALPLLVEPGATLRVLVLAGAPTPELKYLRRWATDAGVSLDTRISLGAGMQIGDAPVSFDAASLGRFDLIVLDQRAWQTLGSAQRVALDRAVHDGLGLLLRLPGALSGDDRAMLRRLGFNATTSGADSKALHLPAASTGADAADAAGTSESLPSLTRGPLRITAADGSPLLRDAGGAPIATWRAHGAGRIGVATFDDSFRLVLAGHGDRHGDLWGALFSTLARAHGTPGPTIENDARAGQRVVLCDVDVGAKVDAPDGHTAALAIDPASGACAGFWPQLPGWHLLRDGKRRLPFHVRATNDAPGLDAAALREATQRLAATAAPARAASASASASGPRWPWFLAWLLLASASWWFERSRPGTARARDTASTS